MKILFILGCVLIFASSCKEQKPQATNPLIGTWQLVSATSTQGDSTVSTFDPKLKMIKMINPTHFSFFSHDLHNGKDSLNASYSAGGGPYSLNDSIYTEHLEYFNDRKWEGNSFNFIIKFTGDTLIQKGVEKVENLGVDHIIVEKYIKLKN